MEIAPHTTRAKNCVREHTLTVLRTGERGAGMGPVPRSPPAPIPGAAGWAGSPATR